MRRQYPSYQHSGVEWLGEVPEHWDTTRISALARPGKESFTDGDWVELPYITNSGVRLIQTGNIGIGKYREQGFRYIDESSFDELHCTEVDPGDVLICRLADPVGRACRAPNLGVRMITSVDVCILKLSEEYSAVYLTFLLSSKRYLSYVESLVRGGTRDRISRSMLGAIKLPNPPPEEQRAIAAFLDGETDKIDTLVAKNRLLLERLAEYRTALITRTVTKGLSPEAARDGGFDPNPPLKPSGVEWIGEVPEHWLMTRLRFLATISTGDADTIDEVEDGQYPFFVRSDRVHAIDSFCYEGEAVLLAGDGNVEDTIHHYVGKYDCHQRVYQLNQLTNIDGRYLYFYMKACFRPWITDGTAKSTVASLRMPMLLNLPVALPPITEQRAIAACLDRQTERIDTLASRVEAAIERMQEYRTALITAAVTGKIDVRDHDAVETGASKT